MSQTTLLLHRNCKSWLACKLLVSYMPLACVVGRAHDASSKGKHTVLYLRKVILPLHPHPALEIMALCSFAAWHCRLKASLFHRYLSNRQHTAPLIH